MWNNTPLTARLGLRFPIVQGPFGGGYSSVALAAAVSNEGGLGSFGAVGLTPAEIVTTTAAIRAKTEGAFAINLWVPMRGEDAPVTSEAFAGHVARLRPYYEAAGVEAPSQPAAYAQRYEDQVAAVLEARPPVLSLVMGAPTKELVAECHRRSIAVLATATTVEEARVLEGVGVDAIVASGSDAGGHRGSFLRPAEASFVGTMSLVPQVAGAVGVPVVAAGGVADGRGVVAALALGAAGVQVGTAFLAADESNAPEVHKALLGTEDARWTTLTRVYSGRHARGIPNEFLRTLAALEAEIPPYPVQNWLTQPFRRAAGATGKRELLALWAGQSAALAKRRPAAAVFAALVAEAEATLRRLG